MYQVYCTILQYVQHFIVQCTLLCSTALKSFIVACHKMSRTHIGFIVHVYSTGRYYTFIVAKRTFLYCTGTYSYIVFVTYLILLTSFNPLNYSLFLCFNRTSFSWAHTGEMVSPGYSNMRKGETFLLVCSICVPRMKSDK